MGIKIAIVGIGNFASSLVQGVEYYKSRKEKPIGLMHEKIGRYSVEDIEFVTAFDCDKRKVGRDLAEAIFVKPNCTVKFCDLPKTGIEVKKAPILDGIGEYTKDVFLVDENQKPVNVVDELKNSGAEILINYMPVGSTKATQFYAQCALDAGIAFINAMPVFIASDKEWASKFEEKNLPVLGDDVKSQIGATIVHRVLTKLANDRGVKIDHMYQLNIGGNTDFLNMLERERLLDKKVSKTEAVQSQLDKPLSKEDIHIGPSDYVPWLKDTKICYIRMEGRVFGDIPIYLDLKLQVVDSPNSAGVMIDAIRLTKLALDRKIGGVLYSASAYLMKHPPKQFSDSEAFKMVEEFIEGKRER